MSLRQVFENRSGRVIAVFRVALASVFFAALLFEPQAIQNGLPHGQQILGFYLGVSLVVLPLIWRHWWYDHKLALPLLVLDVFVFLVAVFITEGPNPDFRSPFLAIYALTVLSATLRWDWRAGAQTGVIVTIAFVAAGLTLIALDLPLEINRFARRGLYMIALLIVLVWFGMQRSDPKVPAIIIPPEGRNDEALTWITLDYAKALTSADTCLLAWSPTEEPWTQLRSAKGGEQRSERIGPEGLCNGGSGLDVRLFDRRRGRELTLGSGNRACAMALRDPLPLAEWGGVESGLALPFAGVSGSGLIVLGGIVGAGPDFLPLGKAIAREVATAFDRVAVGRLERDSLVTRTRSAIARDLHDSVAQSLAGACFRLEALRRKVRDNQGADAESEIVSVRDALRREQTHIRVLIDSLRTPALSIQQHDLRTDINATLADAGAHWGLAVALDAPGSVEVPGWLSHELQQLVREAVANAARHGKATRIGTRIELVDERIRVHIADDGKGFEAGTRPGEPWSISERVTALRGQLSVETGPDGTRLTIFLPRVSTNGDPA